MTIQNYFTHTHLHKFRTPNVNKINVVNVLKKINIFITTTVLQCISISGKKIE